MEIRHVSIDDLNLDPLNPRLGRNYISSDLNQEKVLELMSDWTLDELAVSFAESGFWPQEALIVVREPIYGEEALVVIEGNRRLAALKTLRAALLGEVKSRKWRDIAESAKNLQPDFFDRIPCIEVSSREDVSAFLGFRHVTGIKEWLPAEKAQFIAHLIEKEGLTYEQVMRKIGSKTPAVRSHYIAYRLLLQLEQLDGVDVERVEDKFSVLYLSLRTQGVQGYLGINPLANPDEARTPVQAANSERLCNYSRWVFGDSKNPPLLSDSRQIDKFGKVLLSEDAVQYLEGSDSPNFEFAVKKAGGDVEEVRGLLIEAGDNLEISFGTLHMHVDDSGVARQAKRLAMHLVQVLNIFPDLKELVRDKI